MLTHIKDSDTPVRTSFGTALRCLRPTLAWQHEGITVSCGTNWFASTDTQGRVRRLRGEESLKVLFGLLTAAVESARRRESIQIDSETINAGIHYILEDNVVYLQIGGGHYVGLTRSICEQLTDWLGSLTSSDYQLKIAGDSRLVSLKGGRHSLVMTVDLSGNHGKRTELHMEKRGAGQLERLLLQVAGSGTTCQESVILCSRTITVVNERNQVFYDLTLCKDITVQLTRLGLVCLAADLARWREK